MAPGKNLFGSSKFEFELDPNESQSNAFDFGAQPDTQDLSNIDPRLRGENASNEILRQNVFSSQNTGRDLRGSFNVSHNDTGSQSTGGHPHNSFNVDQNMFGSQATAADYQNSSNIATQQAPRQSTAVEQFFRDEAEEDLMEEWRRQNEPSSQNSYGHHEGFAHRGGSSHSTSQPTNNSGRRSVFQAAGESISNSSFGRRDSHQANDLSGVFSEFTNQPNDVINRLKPQGISLGPLDPTSLDNLQMNFGHYDYTNLANFSGFGVDTTTASAGIPSSLGSQNPRSSISSHNSRGNVGDNAFTIPQAGTSSSLGSRGLNSYVPPYAATPSNLNSFFALDSTQAPNAAAQQPRLGSPFRGGELNYPTFSPGSDIQTRTEPARFGRGLMQQQDAFNMNAYGNTFGNTGTGTDGYNPDAAPSSGVYFFDNDGNRVHLSQLLDTGRASTGIFGSATRPSNSNAMFGNTDTAPNLRLDTGSSSYGTFGNAGTRSHGFHLDPTTPSNRLDASDFGHINYGPPQERIDSSDLLMPSSHTSPHNRRASGQPMESVEDIDTEETPRQQRRTRTHDRPFVLGQYHEVTFDSDDNEPPPDRNPNYRDNVTFENLHPEFVAGYASAGEGDDPFINEKTDSDEDYEPKARKASSKKAPKQRKAATKTTKGGELSSKGTKVEKKTRSSTGKARKKRAPRGKLMRPDEDFWQRTTLGFEYIWRREPNLPSPYSAVAEHVDPSCTGNALQQSIWKLRRRRLAANQPVPPAPSSGRSGSGRSSRNGPSTTAPSKTPKKVKEEEEEEEEESDEEE